MKRVKSNTKLFVLFALLLIIILGLFIYFLVAYIKLDKNVYNIEEGSVLYTDTLQYIKIDKKVEGIVRSDFFGQTRYYAGYAWAFGNSKSNEFAAGMVHRRLNLELGYSAPSGTIDCGGNFLPTRDQKDIWTHHHTLEHAVAGRVGLVVGQSEQVCLVTQLGYTSLMMKGFKCPYNETPDDPNHKSHMQTGSIGFRLDYMLTKWFALTATTELDFRIGQDDYVKDIIDKASVSMNDWATGLRFKVGATFVL